MYLSCNLQDIGLQVVKKQSTGEMVSGISLEIYYVFMQSEILWWTERRGYLLLVLEDPLRANRTSGSGCPAESASPILICFIKHQQ